MLNFNAVIQKNFHIYCSISFILNLFLCLINKCKSSAKAECFLTIYLGLKTLVHLFKPKFYEKSVATSSNRGSKKKALPVIVALFCFFNLLIELTLPKNFNSLTSFFI